jgi:hypothetical protein
VLVHPAAPSPNLHRVTMSWHDTYQTGSAFRETSIELGDRHGPDHRRHRT